MGGAGVSMRIFRVHSSPTSTTARCDAAHRTREVCGRVFRYAIATGRAKRDIAGDLRDALAPTTTTLMQRSHIL
jgi:hypothetical protein